MSGEIGADSTAQTRTQEDIILTIQQPGRWSDLELRACLVLLASMSKMYDVQVCHASMSCKYVMQVCCTNTSCQYATQVCQPSMLCKYITAVHHPRRAKKDVMQVCRANIQWKYYVMQVCRINILCNDGAQVCSKI